MDPRRFLCCSGVLLLLLMPRGLPCMTVHMVTEQPVYVVPGSSLLLTARIQPLREASAVTWEREPESRAAAAAPAARVTLATCAAGSHDCAGTGPRVHVSVRQQEMTLRVDGYSRADGGVYALTVTDHTGAKATARCTVREYEAVHHVSVSINVSHSALVCAEAWGTEPRFSWLHERAAVTGAVGRVSEDGATLFVAMTPICGHFTCLVGNKLGHSSAAYSAAPCETEGRGTMAAVACLVVLLLFGGALAFLLLRRYGHNKRGERLREHVDDTI